MAQEVTQVVRQSEELEPSVGGDMGFAKFDPDRPVETNPKRVPAFVAHQALAPVRLPRIPGLANYRHPGDAPLRGGGGRAGPDLGVRYLLPNGSGGKLCRYAHRACNSVSVRRAKLGHGMGGRNWGPLGGSPVRIVFSKSL
jgi:hypothetical protein